MKPNLHNKPVVQQGWLRVLLFCVFYFSLLLGAGFIWFLLHKTTAAGDEKSAGLAETPYLLFIADAAITIGSVWLFRKLIDRRSFESIGFAIDKNGLHAGTGFFLGIFLLCVGSCILYFSKHLAWTNITFNGNDLFIGLGLMLIISFYEEIAFRGYILNNLLESLPKWPALLISALVFALAHASNPSFSIVAAVNILLAGILLGLNYIYTRNLWFSICFHFTWNFFQGSVLGYEVSGLRLQSLLEHDVSGSDLLTGGKFGFEGSLLATALYLPAIAALAWVYQKKYGLVKDLNPSLSKGAGG